MSRALWFAAGAGAGIYALTRARRAADVLTPEGLADRLAGLSVGARLFRDEVRAGMAEKEIHVRERLGVRLPGSTPQRGLVGGDLDRLDQLGATREGND
jgi:hypothetical protein